MSAFVSAYAQSDLFGKLIILSLVGLSGISWWILAQKWAMFRRARALSSQIEQLCNQRRGELLSLSINHPSNPFLEVFQDTKTKAVEILGKNRFFAPPDSPVFLSSLDLAAVEAHGSVTISKQTKLLERNLFLLSTTVTLAPFLGLLGTVWGILVSFSHMQHGAGLTSSSAALGGLSTALITTVLGLLIAIPALIGYNYFRNHLRVFNSDMQDFLQYLSSVLETQYRKVE